MTGVVVTQLPSNVLLESDSSAAVSSSAASWRAGDESGRCLGEPGRFPLAGSSIGKGDRRVITGGRITANSEIFGDETRDSLGIDISRPEGRCDRSLVGAASLGAKYGKSERNLVLV